MLESLFKAIGYGLCHQLPERSLFGGGYQLPVCARDTGIYFGFTLGLIVLAVLARKSRPSELPRWPVLVLVGLFIAAMGFDGTTSYAGLRSTTNDIRLATGLATGWGLSALTWPMVNAQVWRAPGDGRVPDGARQVMLWLGGVAAAFPLVRWAMPVLGAGFPVALVIAILATFATINMVFIGLIPRFERRAASLRDLWLPLLLANGLTVLELAGAAWLRSLAESLL
ncbi:MAG: DUF2085 domain-containing protein [Actinobacteria bacterium]|nr:DUF2085 domain-containing protein [Actinomycetota bacterium]